MADLQHLLDFANNVPIYQGYHSAIDGYTEDEYDNINNVTKIDTSKETIDELDMWAHDSHYKMYFMCAKSVCGLMLYKKMLTLSTTSMVDSIKLRIRLLNNLEHGISMYIFDNKQFADVLTLMDTLPSSLSICFDDTKDGVEIVCCKFKYYYDDTYNCEIIICIELTNHSVFQKYISMLSNINIIHMNYNECEYDVPNQDHQYKDHDIITNIDAMKSIIRGLTQIKSTKKLRITNTIYAPRLQIIMDYFKNTNIEHLETTISNKLVYELVDTLKLKKLYLPSVGENIDGDSLMAQSIIKQHTLNKLIIGEVTHYSESFNKTINDSTISKISFTEWNHDEYKFMDFCKTMPFKRNFDVVTLKYPTTSGIKHITNMLNNSYYIGQLNVHFHRIDQYYLENEIHDFDDFVNHFDNCITVGNIDFYDEFDKPVEDDEFDCVSDALYLKLKNGAMRRNTIRCVLLMKKIGDNYMATIPKCVIMYMITHFL